jgi:two-component system nitrogen regulation sensor histidine kinase NtrY
MNLIQHKETRIRTWILTVLLILTVLSYLVPGFVLRDSEKHVAQIVEQRIQSDEIEIHSIARNLQEILLTNGMQSYQIKALEYQTIYSGRFAFYLYENNTLSHWTDNHIPVPDTYNGFASSDLKKIGSFQVIAHCRSFRQFNLVFLQIVKLEYPFQNDFLSNQLASYFGIDADLTLSNYEGEPIRNIDGETLFYTLSYSKPKGSWGGTGFLFFTLSFFLLFGFSNKVFPKWLSYNSYLSIAAFVIVVMVWYALHLLLKIPQNLWNSELFSSQLFAFKYFGLSLGTMFFFSLILFLIVLFVQRNPCPYKSNTVIKSIQLLLLLAFFYLIILVAESLVFDAQFTLDLYQLASLDFFSYLALWIIFILFLSWTLLAYIWLQKMSTNKSSFIKLLFILASVSLTFSLVLFIYSYKFWSVFLLASLGIVLVSYYQTNKNKNSLSEVIAYLIFFTLVSSWYLNEFNHIKERNYTMVSAMNLQMENDPFLESDFSDYLPALERDTNIRNLTKLENFSYLDDSLKTYISQNYFQPHLSIYNINLIYCNELSQITILPENTITSCYQYWDDRINESESIIEKGELYLVESGFQYRNYIGSIELFDKEQNQSRIYIEFVSKTQQQIIGLPAILEESHVLRSPLKKKYSYAYYSDGILSNWSGRIDYKQYLADYRLSSFRNVFFVSDGIQHFVFSGKENNVLFISIAKPEGLQILASFAFVFLFFSLLSFLLYIIFGTSSLQNSFNSLRGRLQYSMIILLVFSFVLIGFSSLYYIIYLNKQKNSDNLLEKAQSVLIELEHKLSDIQEFNDDDKVYVESLLAKFSEVFFTDITLYSRDGRVLASSRPQVFKSDLLAGHINAHAYYELNELKYSYLIQDENIGTQTYLSAYLSFRNQDNHSVAFLNLPYFAKQYELEEEVSGFIVAFLNIYLFLLLITILITIVISRYLSRPLQLVKEKISQINLQKVNEKIDWNKNDEIGELFKEYNRMVEELDESAKKLALSQREFAWREMAQQIAHEIKNPLTPMKLNVQYLEKAWDDGMDQYEERMKRITKALKEQIDVLSETAGQFSTFAAIEKIKPELFELKTVLENVIAVFKANSGIQFNTKFVEDDCRVYVDKNQIIRVFNNIFKNAVQALNHQENPRIDTICSLINGHVVIEIKDNGVGIPKKEISRVFEPRFTTKSGGMGFGLALVKKMIDNAGSTIEVQSVEGLGTKFTITIPNKEPAKS